MSLDFVSNHRGRVAQTDPSNHVKKDRENQKHVKNRFPVS